MKSMLLSGHCNPQYFYLLQNYYFLNEQFPKIKFNHGTDHSIKLFGTILNQAYSIFKDQDLENNQF